MTIEITDFRIKSFWSNVEIGKIQMTVGYGKVLQIVMG